MDNALDLAKTFLLWIGGAFGRTYLGMAGVSLCIYSVHLVVVQPKPEYNQVGWTDQKRALLLAVPLFIIGFVLACVAWGEPQ